MHVALMCDCEQAGAKPKWTGQRNCVEVGLNKKSNSKHILCETKSPLITTVVTIIDHLWTAVIKRCNPRVSCMRWAQVRLNCMVCGSPRLPCVSADIWTQASHTFSASVLYTAALSTSHKASLPGGAQRLQMPAPIHPWAVQTSLKGHGGDGQAGCVSGQPVAASSLTAFIVPCGHVTPTCSISVLSSAHPLAPALPYSSFPTPWLLESSQAGTPTLKFWLHQTCSKSFPQKGGMFHQKVVWDAFFTTHYCSHFRFA